MSDTEEFEEAIAAYRSASIELDQQRQRIAQWSNDLINIWGQDLLIIARVADNILRQVNFSIYAIDRESKGDLRSSISLKSQQPQIYGGTTYQHPTLNFGITVDGNVTVKTNAELEGFPRIIPIYDPDRTAKIKTLLADYVKGSLMKMLDRQRPS
ncbi:MAG: hypothetical protein ACRYGM_05280 [Janthinobacterium lividum]